MRGANVLSTVLLCALTSAPQSSAAQATKPATDDAIKQADAAFRAGSEAREKGNLEVARTKFSEVVRLAPQIAEGHEALGAVLMELGKPSEGLAEFQAAAKLKPADVGIETNLAVAYARAGQPEKALPHFEKALSLSRQGSEPANAALYDAYARALAAVGRRGQALDQFAAEEALTGPRADLDDAIGTVYAQQGKWPEAESRFQHALSLDGTYTHAQIHLGVVYRMEGRFPESISMLAAAAEKDSSNGEAVVEYGRSLAAAGKDEDAVREFTQAIKLDPALPGRAT